MRDVEAFFGEAHVPDAAGRSVFVLGSSLGGRLPGDGGPATRGEALVLFSTEAAAKQACVARLGF